MPHDDGRDDASFDDDEFAFEPPIDLSDNGGVAPLPAPDDRLWRHPSEMGATAMATAAPTPATTIRRARSHTALVAVMAAMAGSSITLATVLVLGAFRPVQTSPGGIERVSVSDEVHSTSQPIAVAEKVLPSVARIQVRKTDAGGESVVPGNAVMFRSNGYLITTADLVDGYESISVTIGEQAPVDAAVEGIDHESDIAVLRIGGDAVDARNDYPVAVLGQSSEVQVGSPVIAIDSAPYAGAGPSIPVGLVNGVGTRVESEDPQETLVGMLQTNPKLTGTATGAPVIDYTGAVIGIVTSRGYDSPAPTPYLVTKGSTTGDTLVVRYATPIDYARQVADSLIRNKRVERAYLGVVGSAISDEEARSYDLVSGGMKVESVNVDGPASTGYSPLRKDDIIVRLETTPVRSMDDLRIALRERRPGDTVAIWYLRNGTLDSAIITLTERP